MGDLSNYDIYQIDGLAIEGYIFSIQEDADEEPTFHYYMITIEPNKKPSITKLNNTIEIITEIIPPIKKAFELLLPIFSLELRILSF